VPEIRGNEWDYVKECLDSGWVSSVGPFVDRFERQLADYLGARHAVATVNGTSALHTATLVVGVQPGDEVLVSSLTFVAPANAVRYAGAWPVFIDAEPRYWQMDPERVRSFLERGCRQKGGRPVNRATGRRVSALVVVHVLGHPADMDPILEVARGHGLAVIEDASESLGARYKGRMAGTLGDVACFSFNGNKLITTGGGGMLVTDDEALARRARYLTTQAKDDPVEYVHREVGYNYRLTNVQAAMGCAQLEQLDDYIAAKRRLAARYAAALEGVAGVTPMPEAGWAFSTYWLYTALVDPHGYGADSRQLLRALQERQIQARPLWQPLHRSPAHRGAQACGGGVAEDLYRRALSLPCSVGLGDAEQDAVIEAIMSERREWA
jgi:perosamine synthetase